MGNLSASHVPALPTHNSRCHSLVAKSQAANPTAVRRIMGSRLVLRNGILL